MDQGIKDLIARYDKSLQIISCNKLFGGVSSEMHIVELKGSKNFKKVVTRTHNSAYRMPIQLEAKVLNKLRQKQIKVPKILFNDDKYILMEWINAKPIYTFKNFTYKVINQYVEKLIKIHSIKSNDLELSFLKTEHEVINDRLNLDHPIDHSMREPMILEELSKLSIPKFSDSRLLHGDPWPGNILWNNGELFSVVDWEQPCVGCPLWDLSILRLDVLWMFGQSTMDKITDLYFQKSGLSRDNLYIWDLYSSIRPLGRVSVWGGGMKDLGRPDIDANKMRQCHAFFVDNALSNMK